MGVDENDMRVYRPETPADANMIGVYNLEGDVSQDREYLDHVYEEARQIIGITDSFQGRRDSTATSGTAKEFAAAQTARAARVKEGDARRGICGAVRAHV